MAYAGLLATLLMMPLAWCDRNHRFINVFFYGRRNSRRGLVSEHTDSRRSVAAARPQHDVAQPFCLCNVVRRHFDGGHGGWTFCGGATCGGCSWFWGPVGVLAVLLLWCANRSTGSSREIIDLGVSCPSRFPGSGRPKYGGGRTNPIELRHFLFDGRRPVYPGPWRMGVARASHETTVVPALPGGLARGRLALVRLWPGPPSAIPSCTIREFPRSRKWRRRRPAGSLAPAAACRRSPNQSHNLAPCRADTTPLTRCGWSSC